MRNLAIGLIWASVLSFLIATILVVFERQSLFGVHTGAEGFSRASSNLALIAIALGVWFRSDLDDD
jgi:hypothetical protein